MGRSRRHAESFSSVELGELVPEDPCKEHRPAKDRTASSVVFISLNQVSIRQLFPGEKKRRVYVRRGFLSNVDPGLINLWLINRGVSSFSGDSSLLEGTPPNNGTGLLILGQH